MALKFEMLKIKRKVERRGEEIVDLLEPTLVVDTESENFNVDGVHVVSRETEMRPDLIALSFYGDSSYADLILKANGVSNPFSIEEGDRLLIPKVDPAKSFYGRQKQPTPPEQEIEDPRITPDRKGKKDKSRQEKQKEASGQRRNGASENRPPNELREDEQPFRFEDGRVRLGNDS